MRALVIGFSAHGVPVVFTDLLEECKNKTDDRDLVTNCCPVSLLSTVNKIFEKIVFKIYVYNHIKENVVFSDFPSVFFIPGCSTITQCMEVYHMFCSSIKNED